MNGVAAAVVVGGFSVDTALFASYLFGNPVVSVVIGVVTYMAEGYALYHPRAEHIAVNYRRSLNLP